MEGQTAATIIWWLPTIAIPFLLGSALGRMARGRGRHFWTWFVLGVVAFPVALIVLLSLPRDVAKAM